MEEEVNQAKKRGFMRAGAVVVTLVLLAGIYMFAADEEPKEKGKAETIQCTAMGTSTQLGKSIGVTIIIDEYSTPEDKQILLEAFEKKGSEGLCNAVSKMSSKGRLAITGTVGYDVNFIREFPTANGGARSAWSPIVPSLSARPGTVAARWTTTCRPSNSI